MHANAFTLIIKLYNRDSQRAIDERTEQVPNTATVHLLICCTICPFRKKLDQKFHNN